MKMYNKPEIFVTEFVPNEAISVCPNEPTTLDEMVTVNCVISGSHTIFFEACGKVDEGADYDTLTIVNDFYTYTGTGNDMTYSQDDYMIWSKNGDGGLTPNVYDADSGSYSGFYGSSESSAVNANGDANTKGERIFEALLDIIFGKDNKKKWQDYHGGVITPKVESVRNAS